VIFWASFRREKRMLRARLEALGIDPRVFSDECLTELIDRGTGYCRPPWPPRPGGLAQAIEGLALNVAGICFGDKGYTAAEIAAAVERGDPFGTIFWEVLAKHDPKRFSLRELEKTQSINKMLEAVKNDPADVSAG
jgi:hypothetical protein